MTAIYTPPSTNAGGRFDAYDSSTSTALGAAGEFPSPLSENETNHLDVTKVAPSKEATVHGLRRLTGLFSAGR